MNAEVLKMGDNFFSADSSAEAKRRRIQPLAGGRLPQNILCEIRLHAKHVSAGIYAQSLAHAHLRYQRILREIKRVVISNPGSYRVNLPAIAQAMERQAGQSARTGNSQIWDTGWMLDAGYSLLDVWEWELGVGENTEHRTSNTELLRRNRMLDEP